MYFRLPNGHINFEKFWQLAKQVTEFLTWKQVMCPFEKDGRVIAFLQASPILTENGKKHELVIIYNELIILYIKHNINNLF